MLKDYFLNGKVKEECGIFGVYNAKDAASLVYLGLHVLQHRGQEGAGIAVSDGEYIHREKGEGLVSQVFNAERLASLKGFLAAGHVRYATTGGGCIENVQPILIRSHTGDFIIAHNGNLVNAAELKKTLEASGSIFHTTSDSEIIGHLIQRESGSFKEKLLKALPKIEGAFAFLIMTKDTLYAIRDKNGLRPLSLGRAGTGILFSSESAAFSIAGGTFERDIEPGEVATVDTQGISRCFYTQSTQSRLCAMEYVYFSRPDSVLNGLNVHKSREICGEILAQEAPADADIVIGVPDSSLSAAMGYASLSGIPYEMGLIKSRYIGRTFIKPNQQEREQGVKLKLSAMDVIVRGKSVVLVDDSIVRGTTSKYIVRLLKDAGVKAVHMRIASPPIISPCFYGVETSTYAELISASLSPQLLASYLGADSLAFLSLEGMKKALGGEVCLACFTGDYPTPMFRLLHNLKKGGTHERAV